MKERVVTILCSGFGLGFYNPGLIVRQRLRERGLRAEALVFETFMKKDKQEKIGESRKAYHEQFSLALIATRMPKDIRDSIDEERTERLLRRWLEEGREHFVVLSGHWVYLLDAYKPRLEEAGGKLEVDLLYVDTDLSPSWKGLRKFHPEYNAFYRDVWLYGARQDGESRYIRVSDEEPVDYRLRAPRYVVHGGGWGLGTYRGKLGELEERGLTLDIVAYEPSEAEASASAERGRRYYMNDPAWTAWEKEEREEHGFPPFAEVRSGERPEYGRPLSRHGLYDVIRRAKAIVSKPGAGTLMDSLSAATPVILLEPFGAHEQRNSEIWLEKGLGIPYEEWRRAGFSDRVLEPIHSRLLEERAAGRDYSEELAERIG